MPQITLTLTDTEARALAALEAIDGRTVAQRFAPHVHMRAQARLLRMPTR